LVALELEVQRLLLLAQVWVQLWWLEEQVLVLVLVALVLVRRWLLEE
jgi:hypothetical protein